MLTGKSVDCSKGIRFTYCSRASPILIGAPVRIQSKSQFWNPNCNHENSNSPDCRASDLLDGIGVVFQLSARSQTRAQAERKLISAIATRRRRSMFRLAEQSELYRRFIAALEKWGAHKGDSVSIHTNSTGPCFIRLHADFSHGSG